jgi:hypothetical protein
MHPKGEEKRGREKREKEGGRRKKKGRRKNDMWAHMSVDPTMYFMCE